MLRTGLRQFEAALDRGQKDTVAQQCKEMCIRDRQKAGYHYHSDTLPLLVYRSE